MDKPRGRDLSWRRSIGQALKAHSTRACAFLLRFPRPRRTLNWLYEHAGPLFQDAFDRFCSATIPPVSFNWSASLGGKHFLLPVHPTPPRSWNAALAWRWSGNRSIRRLYERYLDRSPKGTLFDVGGNDGTHSYPFAAHGYRCVIFEPQPSCIAYIHETCAVNGFTEVSTVRAVVTDEAEGDVDLWVSPSSWFSSRLKEHTERFETANAVRVPAVRLDQFATDQGLYPTVIKIDVEGWEWHVLSGATELLNRHRPNLFVEILSSNEKKADVWHLLNNLGYSCTRIVHFSPSVFERIPTLDAFMETGGRYSDDYFFCAEGSADWLTT
jgi:FkbM family methyltransferase